MGRSRHRGRHRGRGLQLAFTSGSGECEPFDVAKHLTTDRLKAKLGR
jgi:hypothetical protein